MEKVTQAMGHNPFTSIAKAATVALVGLPYLTAVTAWNIFNEKPKEPEPPNRTWMALGVTVMVIAISTLVLCCHQAFSRRNSHENGYRLPLSSPSSTPSSSSSSASSGPSTIDVSQSLQPELLIAQVQQDKDPQVRLQALQESIANFNKALPELERACQKNPNLMAQVLLGKNVKGLELPADAQPREELKNILHLYFTYRRSFAPEVGQNLFAREHRFVTPEQRADYLGFKVEHLFATLFLDPVILAKKPLSPEELCFYNEGTPQGQMRDSYNNFLEQHGKLLHQLYRREPEGSEAWHICPWLVPDLNTNGHTQFFADRQYYLDRWGTLRV